MRARRPAGTITPGSGSQQNSQCVLNGAGSSVSVAGNVLTLNVSIDFSGGICGQPKYLCAGGQSDRVERLAAGRHVDRPGGGAAGAGVGDAEFGDAAAARHSLSCFRTRKGYYGVVDGTGDRQGTLSAARAAISCITRAASSLSGERWPVSGWVGSTLGQTGTLQNSQCTMNAAASSVFGQRQQPDR